MWGGRISIQSRSLQAAGENTLDVERDVIERYRQN
jgi:hypothetical protein